MNYYHQTTYLSDPIGNNAIDFVERKKLWSDTTLRIPQMITGTIEDVVITKNSLSRQYCGKAIHHNTVCYQYIDEKWRLVHDDGLEHLVEIRHPQSAIHHPSIYIIDNHNHAFYCRWKSYLAGQISRWSHLIHIDQHSDLNIPMAKSSNLQVASDKSQAISDINKTSQIIYDDTRWSLWLAAWSPLSQVAAYTNEVLDIASFIKPAKEIGLISDYEMILTEYSLLDYNTTVSPSYHDCITIVDIDLDFRAPEMGIEQYTQTIQKIRQMIALPAVWCVTIATSPTYIDQWLALEILRDIFDAYGKFFNSQKYKENNEKYNQQPI